jgi:hypothetical protein
MQNTFKLLGSMGLCALAATASAHVVLEDQAALAGSSYKLCFGWATVARVQPPRVSPFDCLQAFRVPSPCPKLVGAWKPGWRL